MDLIIRFKEIFPFLVLKKKICQSLDVELTFNIVLDLNFEPSSRLSRDKSFIARNCDVI